MTSYPQGVWTFNPDGYPAGSALYNGPILFPAGIDPNSTQTVVCVFGPAGGRMNVPPLAQGDPGLPPVIQYGGTTTLPAGGSATATWEQLSPGAPGVAPVYEVFFAIPKGDPGANAANTLISPQPTDLEGSPAVNSMIGYDGTANKAQWQSIPFMNMWNVPGSSISTTGTSAGQTRTLTYITIPPQPRAYIPIVLGADAVTTGTINTQVDLVARLGGAPNTQGGVVIGRGRGPIGAVAGTNPVTVRMNINFQNLLSGGTQTVAANTSATIYLNCEQQNPGTSDQYATGGASFTIGAVPVQS